MSTPTTKVGLRPGATVAAALVGGGVGAVVVGWVTGQVVALLGDDESSAWAALGAAILGAAAGAFLGAALALALVFRSEPPSARRWTWLTTLVAGPLVLVGLVLVADAVQQDWPVPPLLLAVALAVAALLGRWGAVRST